MPCAALCAVWKIVCVPHVKNSGPETRHWHADFARPYPAMMASPDLYYCFLCTLGDLRVDPPATGHELGAPVTSLLFCAGTTLRIAGRRPGTGMQISLVPTRP